MFKKGHKCYHGTNLDVCHSIMHTGSLARPGAQVYGPNGEIIKIPIRKGHIKSSFWRDNLHTGKREEFDPTDKIFFSPSYRYSSKNMYATPKVIEGHKVQVMFLLHRAWYIRYWAGNDRVAPLTQRG